MATPDIHVPEPTEAPESPLLAIFALLIVVGVFAIGLMIAVPTILTLIIALATVMGFAAAVSYLLAGTIGE
jgi:hypothetical protein